MREILNGIFVKEDVKSVLFTKNLVPGTSVYGERLFHDKIEFREFIPSKSKFAALVVKGFRDLNEKNNASMIYLGASTGTTVSHFSDIFFDGKIFAVEKSSFVAKQLVFLAEQRKNVYPLIKDAKHPESYEEVGKVDFIYQDVAEKQQLEIFLKNIKLFLKPRGIAILVVKARSVDITKKPKQIFDTIEEELLKQFEIIFKTDLFPYQKDHYTFVITT